MIFLSSINRILQLYNLWNRLYLYEIFVYRFYTQNLGVATEAVEGVITSLGSGQNALICIFSSNNKKNINYTPFFLDTEYIMDTKITCVYHNIKTTVSNDPQGQVDVIYTDIQKTFDVIGPVVI